MNLKKLASLALALCMVFALAACGGESSTATDPPATEPAATEPTCRLRASRHRGPARGPH